VEQINTQPQNTTPEPIKTEDLLSGIIILKGKEYTYQDIKRLAGIMGNQTRLAAVLNCTPQHITYLKENDQTFALAINTGKEWADGQVVNALFENAVKYKDTAAQKYYLNNKVKSEFADISKQEIALTNIDQVVKEITNQYEITPLPATPPITGQ
jgi:hypothetical protein